MISIMHMAMDVCVCVSVSECVCVCFDPQSSQILFGWKNHSINMWNDQKKFLSFNTKFFQATEQKRKRKNYANETDSVLDWALWSTIFKNPDESTGPLACPFACLLLTCLLAPPSLLCSQAPLRSLVRLLTHFAHSLACGTVNDLMAIFLCFSNSGP